MISVAAKGEGAMLMMTWFDDVQRMDPKTLSQLMKLGSKVGKLLAFTNNLKVVGREE